VSIERWTDERLDKLADGVEQVVGQLDRLGNQISLLGNRIEQTCNRVDAFVESKHDSIQSSPLTDKQLSDQFSTQSNHQSSPLLDRVTTLESQMQQLMQRVQYLERREVAHLTAQVQAVTGVGAVGDDEDDGIEDEPDEILWDFFDPSEQRK
jgi:hypothetical protein